MVCGSLLIWILVVRDLLTEITVFSLFEHLAHVDVSSDLGLRLGESLTALVLVLLLGGEVDFRVAGSNDAIPEREIALIN